MEDLSHWDFAEHFKAKEAAELIAGIPPEKNTQIFGVMGEEAAYVAKITPILRRMERAYLAAANALGLIANFEESPGDALKKYQPDELNLHSELMRSVLATPNNFGASAFKTEPHKFEKAYFERQEIARWLKAIGMRSHYSFEAGGGAFSVTTSASASKRDSNFDVFSRMGDDREELHQWLIMDTWPYEAAMFLLAGVIPTATDPLLGYHRIAGGILHNDHGEKEQMMSTIEVLTRLWNSNPGHPDVAEPAYFFRWAETKGIEISWLDAAKAAGYFKQETPAEASRPAISSKIQDTLLTIIGLLCKEAKLDYKKPAKTANLIQAMASTSGISIGETTIEGYLKKIPDALASRMK